MSRICPGGNNFQCSVSSTEPTDRRLPNYANSVGSLGRSGPASRVSTGRVRHLRLVREAAGARRAKTSSRGDARGYSFHGSALLLAEITMPSASVRQACRLRVPETPMQSTWLHFSNEITPGSFALKKSGSGGCKLLSEVCWECTQL